MARRPAGLAPALPRAGRRVRLDGGLATTLQGMGLLAPTLSPTPLVDRDAAALLAAHRAFLEGGAEVVLTATLCGHRGWLGAAAPRMNRAAVALARRAVLESGRAARVAGSMGPWVRPGERWGPAARAAAEPGWAEQAEALSGCDLLALETFVSPAELVAAVTAVRRVWAGTLVACLVPDGRGALWGGEGLAEAGRALVDAGADVVGLNCGVGPPGFAAGLATLRAAVAVPLWAKPNAGGLDRAAWRAAVDGLDADWLGGCCGVGPGW